MVQEYPILSTMSLKKALEILGKGPCYHMQEIWGKPDMKETLSKWSEAGELSDIEAGEVRFRQCLVSFNKKVDFSVVSKIKLLIKHVSKRRYRYFKKLASTAASISQARH